MARPRNPVPNLKWDESRQQYICYVRGKRVYLGRDRLSAERQRLAIAAGEPRQPVSGVLTVATALDIYHEWAKKHYTDARTLGRIRAAMLIAVEQCGTFPADEFRAKLLRKIRDALLAKGKFCRLYVNHIVSRIKTAVRWLVEEEIVKADCLASVRSVKALEPGDAPDRAKIVPVSEADVEATLPFLTETLRAMVRVQQLTGMRPGELCRMRRCDISTSPEQRLIDGERTIAAMEIDGAMIWFYVPASHKNSHRGQARHVGLGPEAQVIIAPLLMAREPEDYLFRPVDSLAGSRGVRCCKPGRCYSVGGYGRAVQRACKRAGVPTWNPRQLRKNAAEVADRAMGAGAAGDLLGHAASRRAIDTYCRGSLERAAAVARRVG